MRHLRWGLVAVLAVAGVLAGQVLASPAPVAAKPKPTTTRPATTTTVAPTTTLAPTTTTAAPTTTVGPTTTTVPPVGRGDQVGVSVPYGHWRSASDATIATDLDNLTATGARWLRVDVAATELETAPGVYNWGVLDRVMAAADARGLKVLGICTTLGPSMRPAGSPWNTGPTTDTQRQAFAGFCVAAAQHLTGVDAWELWNEPNLDQFWNPTPSPSAYRALLAVVYPALKQVTSVPVIAGGTGWAGAAPDILTSSWYSQLYALGGQGFFDAATTHPYIDFAGAAWGETEQSRQVRVTMNSGGDSAKALWGTEAGAPEGTSGVTETRQAELVTETLNFWVGPAVAPAGPLFIYTLKDVSCGERCFGLVDATGRRKPAFAAVHDWVIA